MTNCSKCGKSSSDYAGGVREKATCTAANCKGGKIRCPTCIWLPNGTMVKCCSDWECQGTGKRKCAAKEAIKGTGVDEDERPIKSGALLIAETDSGWLEAIVDNNLDPK
ncbi:hypothetical protein P885DRAFT_63671 [Corynascus similis CBS 632.67]